MTRLTEEKFQKNLIVSKQEICLGDLINLEGGFVDLDILLTEGQIMVDESGYSGDQQHIYKKQINTQKDIHFSKDNLIFSGSKIDPCQAKGIVIGLGHSTLFETKHHLFTKRKDVKKSFFNFIQKILRFLIIVGAIQSLIFY